MSINKITGVNSIFGINAIPPIAITPSNIKKNHWELVKERGKIRRRGSILDVFELEGSYALKNAEELCGLLSINEKLSVCESADAPNKDMLTVKTENGKTVGFLPSGISMLPRQMLIKGCNIYCYVEYKDFTNSLLTICVSMYSQDY